MTAALEMKMHPRPLMIRNLFYDICASDHLKAELERRKDKVWLHGTSLKGTMVGKTEQKPLAVLSTVGETSHQSQWKQWKETRRAHNHAHS